MWRFLEGTSVRSTCSCIVAALKSEIHGRWPDAIAGLGLDDLLSDHVTLSSDEMMLISQQIQLRMQQTQVQVNDISGSLSAIL